MHTQAIQTDIFSRGSDLVEFILKHAGDLIVEKSVLAVTSKIVSLSENRLAAGHSNKKHLVQDEADHFLGEIGYGCYLTIKEGLLIASAGIDESNSAEGDFILFPREPQKSCEILCNTIKSKKGLNDFGVIFTDSKTLPLRKGVIGACLAYSGFKGVKNMVGEADLFGRELQMTSINVADALSASATFLMGEGGECRPLGLITGAPIEFCNSTNSKELKIPLKDDLYRPLLEGKLSN